MIFNIRGTSGTGKTHTMRLLMGILGPKEKWLVDDKVHGYWLQQHRVTVIGSYENVCGGCDGIKTQDEICKRVRERAELGHVLFEGLTISHTFQRYADLADELEDKGHETFFYFLDTPLQVALDRVRQRRLDRGEKKPFNPENTIKDYRSVELAYQKFVEDEYNVFRLDSDKIFREVQRRILT